jgi:hypothetical protein
MDIVKFPHNSSVTEEQAYFKVGETYKLYCENYEATEYKIIDVVYKGIEKRLRPAGVTMTVNVNCHVFFSEELKSFDVRDHKNFAGMMWDKWKKHDFNAGEYSVQINCFWNNTSKNDKMYIIVDKKKQPSKKVNEHN